MTKIKAVLRITGYLLLTFWIFGLLLSHQWWATVLTLGFYFGFRGYRVLKRAGAARREARRLSAQADAQHSAFMAGDIGRGVFGER